MALKSDLVQVGFSEKEADWLGDTIDFDITATGANQANAYAITKTITFLTTVAAGTGVRLPLIKDFKGSFIKVINDAGANSVLVYPASGEQIDAKAVNNPIEIEVNTLGAAYAKCFYKRSTTQWVSST